MTRVSCVQLAPVVGAAEHNAALSTEAVATAAAAGAELIVLPELVTSGYCFASADEARGVALGADDPLFDRWTAAAGGAVLVAGFAELGTDGQLYNSAVLIDRDGRRTGYRKVHLWDAEQLVFRPGDTLPPVLDTAVGRVAVMVCYDLEFPEMTRSVALRGADLLAVPTNWPWADRPAGAPAPEVVIAMGAARANRMAIACCDRSGTERGQRWNEATSIIGADGWLLAAAEGVGGVAVADVDLAQSRDKRISSRNDVLADRRPEVYAGGLAALR